MKISLLDCEEYREFFLETYRGLSSNDVPYLFQVDGGGISFWSEAYGRNYLPLYTTNPNKKREIELLKRLYPEAFL